MSVLPRLTVLVLVAFLAAPSADARQVQQPAAHPPRSPGQAFALSLVLPGLGHRYAQHGRWGRGTFYALADAGLWLGLLGTEWRRQALVQSFETLAATRAGARVEDKDRTFFLNLAAYHSSDEYVAVQLRNRAWDRIDYVADPAFQWAWASEEDFLTFRRLRRDAETLRNRRFVLAAALVANRLLAGLTALRAARHANRNVPPLQLSLAAPPPGTDLPRLQVAVTF